MSDFAEASDAPRRRHPIRLAFVTHAMVVGGIQRSIARVVNGLQDEGFECAVISLVRGGDGADWIANPNVVVSELNKEKGNSWRVVHRLARVLRSLQTDIVQSHNWGTLVETCVARRLAVVPCHVHAERGTMFGGTAATGVWGVARSRVMRAALRSADVVMSNAAAVAERVEAACGFPADHVRIIPNGVNLPVAWADLPGLRGATRRELGLGHDAVLVGTVGRLVSVKALDDLLRAFAAVRASHASTHLLVIGDGEERAALLQLVASLGLAGSTHFPGHMTDPIRWLSAMDVYVNCSVSEGMSQAVIEALAVGLPCVVTSVGDSAALVGGEPACGRVVPPRQPTELAGAIRELVIAPARRQQLGAHARERYLARYTQEKMLGRFREMYVSALAQKGERRASGAPMTGTASRG